MDMLEKYTKKERVRKKSIALREASRSSSMASAGTPEGADVIGTSQFSMPDVKSQHFATGAAELDVAEDDEEEVVAGAGAGAGAGADGTAAAAEEEIVD